MKDKKNDPDIRIHRRFIPGTTPWDFPAAQPDSDTLLGAIVDVETTGLDAETGEIIELGILTFEYDTTDRIVGVVDSYSGLQQPTTKLSPEIVELTGITDEDLKGQAIDWAQVLKLVEHCRVFVAHNAQLDRKFVEEHSPIEQFVKRPWACSYNEVPWKKRFPEVTAGALGAVLAGTRREYYEAHRALDDCRAVLRVLSTPIEVLEPVPLEQQAFSDLLVSARTLTRRIWADDAPFSMKDELKLGRRYRWHESARTWHLDLKEPDRVAEEIAWLRDRGVKARVTYIDAKDRWSVRA